jgi:hypothetical protein
LKQTIGENFAIKQKTVSQIIKELLAKLDIVYNGAEVANTISIMTINEDEEYYEVIETLLYEYGYTFDFNHEGNFVVLPIFDQPPSGISNTFNGGNIRGALKETVSKKQYDYIRVGFSEVKTNSNDLVYEDKTEKIVPKGCYFGHEEEVLQAQIIDNGAVHCTYASSKGELIWADVDSDNFSISVSPSNAFTIKKSGTITGETTSVLGNHGKSFAFIAYNNTQGNAKIKEIKAVATTSYTKNAAFTIVKNGNILLEYDSKYLQNKSNASGFTKNLSNYYRYSSIKINLESYADFNYGSFVKVSETGIGELTCRIVRKTYKLNNPIVYELESVIDFVPADITEESSWGNNSTNIASQGPDVIPPTAPTNLVLTLRDDGKVNGTFTGSIDEGSGVNNYAVYRKTPGTNYKTALILEPSVISFLDEGTINGMSYTYKVIATDNSGNISNPSNEATIGTITIQQPYPPIAVSANAFNDYIALSITPAGLAQNDREIFTPVEYKIQISRDSGSTYSDVVFTSNTNYDYYFNRQEEGYPETSALNNYRFKVFSVNIYGNLSTGVVCNLSMGDYKTWKPSTPTGLKGESTGRTLYLTWDKQNIFGTLCYRIQISKDNSNWYKPNLIDDPYASENNWYTGSVNGFYETEQNINNFYQIVPLKGQNTNLGNNRYVIEAVEYYYRICAVNVDTGFTTAWTNSVKIKAEGTSAQDILKNSVGWDQIIPQSILVDKLGVKQLIAGESTLAFIGNSTNVSSKSRAGFQYWALDNIKIGSTTFNKGEFRINSDTGDYFIVDPTDGISFKASKIVMDAFGSQIYGNFEIIDQKTGSKTYFKMELLNDKTGAVLANPKMTLGYDNKTTIDCKGTLYVDTPNYPSF